MSAHSTKSPFRVHQMTKSPSNDFLAKIADRMKLVRQETERMREGILDHNRAKEGEARTFSSTDGYHLVYKLGGFRNVGFEDATIRRRAVDCSIFKDGRRIVAADFLEFRVTEEPTDFSFFDEMDERSSTLANIALAYLSGWDAYKLHYSGSLVVLNHLASDAPGERSIWLPMLNTFIDEKIMKDAFVMLVDPYPHDVVDVINKGHEDDAMQDFALRRHRAKMQFAEHNLGFTALGPDARASMWMYRLAPSHAHEIADPRNFRTDEIGDAMRLENPQRRRL